LSILYTQLYSPKYGRIEQINNNSNA